MKSSDWFFGQSTRSEEVHGPGAAALLTRLRRGRDAREGEERGAVVGSGMFGAAVAGF